MSERQELERELDNLRSNVDECTIGRVDLERKLVSLREELDFDNLAHNEVGARIESQFFADLCSLSESLRQKKYSNIPRAPPIFCQRGRK